MGAKIKDPRLALLLESTSDDQTRYHLNGCYYDGGVWVATDGHRMTIINKDALPLYTFKAAKHDTIYDAQALALGHLVPLEGVGKYPNWKQLLPNVGSLEGVDLTVPIWTKDVKPRYRGAANESSTPGINWSESHGWTTMGSDKAKFRVNLYYLGAIAGMSCKMYSRDALSPIVFKGDEWTYVLMPVRK